MSNLTPVLAIGVAGHAGITAAQMTEATEQMTGAAAEAGFAFDARFVNPEFSEKERQELRELLRSKSWAVVQIGSGFRLKEDNTKLLEDVANMILHEVRPVPKFAFPTKPEEMIPTFQRLTSRQ